MEVAELSATRKAEVEAVKHFISKREDIYRAAYARRILRYPRRCIMIGTTNDNTFLRDHTGNRRFWPVETGVEVAKKSLWKDFTKEYRDQLWAEAVIAYKEGESLFLGDDVLEAEVQEIQLQHTEEEARAGEIQEYLNKLFTGELE